jgi:hypothetical protein
MRGEVVVCLVVKGEEGGIELPYEVQHTYLECERAELPKQEVDGEELAKTVAGGYCLLAGDQAGFCFQEYYQ